MTSVGRAPDVQPFPKRGADMLHGPEWLPAAFIAGRLAIHPRASRLR